MKWFCWFQTEIVRKTKEITWNLITLILEITFNIKCILVPIKSVDYYKFKKPCMDWSHISQNPYMEVLNFSVTVCGDEAFTVVTKSDCRHECGPDLIGQVLLSEKGERSEILLSSHRYREGISYENTARRQLPTSQEERHQQKPTLMAPWSWTSNPQNDDKINFCSLSHSD